MWIAFATVVYWGSGMATGPAWNAWVTSLVRPDERAEATRLAAARTGNPALDAVDADGYWRNNFV